MGEEAPPREGWETAFNENWPSFENTVEAIGPQAAAQLIPELEDLFRRKTFNEPLDECTRQSWIDRFTAARETIAALEGYRAIMKADNTYLLDIYNDLVSELDGYSMNMGALLLTETKFPVDIEIGKLAVGNGIKRACESRRGRIRQLVTHLLAPNCAPVLESESRRYAKISSFQARKTILIHPAERAIKAEYSGNQPRRLTERELNQSAVSLWEFDRIYFYLVQGTDGIGHGRTADRRLRAGGREGARGRRWRELGSASLRNSRAEDEAAGARHVGRMRGSSGIGPAPQAHRAGHQRVRPGSRPAGSRRDRGTARSAHLCTCCDGGRS